MFVILGATGKIGAATIGALRQAGAPVRAAIRDKDKAAQFLNTGCDCVIADIGDVTSLAKAIDGAEAVQALCPIEPQAAEATDAMRRSIDALARAIAMSRPKTVLAISDYGAHLPNGAGLATTFHWLEEALRAAAPNLVLVRSAEHMQNWARVLAVAAATGALPSLHHPLTKLFPTVSAFDVGAICAELLLAPKRSEGVRVVHVEGPKRYTPEDVASATSTVLGRNVAAHELPRSDWEALLSRGMSVSYARLVAELYDAHNAGRIDVEEGGEIRRGPSDLVTAFAAFAPKRGH